MKIEQKVQLIQTYIDDIKSYYDAAGHPDEKQNFKRALEVYAGMLEDVERGKVDADDVYESITGYLYMLQ